jgi:ubiquinone/menaquinone biosynthesis C-methylase UbiE
VDHGVFERMPNIAFRLMSMTMALEDRLHPTIDQRIIRFGIREGMTVVDYGCGQARYTPRLARLVGSSGKVYAVDVQPLAIEAIRQKMARGNQGNIIPVLVHGYDTGLPEHVADIICALDMFFGLKEPTKFLQEVYRIIRPKGVLVIDDGHQSRQATLKKIEAAGQWRVVEETADHLKCVPVHPPEGRSGA